MINVPFKYCKTYLSFLLIFAIVSFLLPCSSLKSQSIQKEVRAVWLTTVDNLDWPKTTEINNRDAQMQSLIGILDKLQSMNFNTIYFQVRPRGNTFYKSSIEPWAKELTGKFGNDPGWDPLEFIIEKANERGIEVHAWINIAKIWSGTTLPQKTAPEHLLRKKSKWCKIYENEWWLDLGYPDARNYTLGVIKEILLKYNIDGLHFDYLRYPGKNFNDRDSYALYGKGSNKDDWRRNNINSLLKDVRKLVDDNKPYVKIGAAPIGIYKSIPGASGWSSYDNLFQDTKYWLDNNLVDYIAPQTYWDIKITDRDPGFGIAVSEWSRLSNGKQVYPGIGLWKKNIANEVAKQIDICRTEKMQGFSIYRFANILENKSAQNLFPSPSSIPELKNGNTKFQNNDIVFDCHNTSDLINMKWTSKNDNIKFFNLYKVTVNNRKLIKILGKSIHSFDLVKNGNDDLYAISYTTLYNEESPMFYPEKVIASGNYNKYPADTLLSDGKAGKELLHDIDELFTNSIYITCYPNPFKDYLLVGYELNQKLPVEVSIASNDGKEIIKLLKGIQNKGKYVLKADGNELKKGIYICTLRAGDTIKQKIIIKK